MIPIVAGLLMGAAMGGGIAALQGKDVLQGALMGGVGGALGGAFMPGVGAAGAGATQGAITEGATSALTSAANPGILGTEFGVQGAMSGAGAAGSGGIGAFLGANKYALAGGALGGMMAPGAPPPSPEQGNIREFSFNPGERNPLFGNPGENYYTADRGFTAGAVTPVEDYTAANGGIIALAEGGETQGREMQRYSRPTRQVDPAVAAYNAQIMERANQQYNVNLRPGPNQVPGSVGYVAPVPNVSKGPTEPIDLINTKSKNDLDMDEIYATLDARYGRNTNNWYAGDSGEGGTAGPDGADNGGLKEGGLMSSYSGGGLSSLGNYSDGGQLLKGPGDGVSDSIPARIGSRQPARLADGEFVVPARIVSELGNGSTDAGAKRLYGMMDRVQKNRKKTVGKGKVAVDAKAHKMLPA